jgi:hypothetical protein
MLFSTLILIPVQGEHDSLEEGVDFSQADKTAKGGYMTRFPLKKKKEVRVLLHQSKAEISLL